MDSFNILTLIKKTPYGEFDYIFLSDILYSYKKPRNIISRLIRNNDIIRVKKGLYVFGKDSLGPAYSKEILANMIYGPSYISLEFALSYYGLIPERVDTVTSITNKKNKFYKTPIGDFSYRYLSNKFFMHGVERVSISDDRTVLMASKEKAIIDLLYQQKNLYDWVEIKSFLFENMRIDFDVFSALSAEKFMSLGTRYSHKAVLCFIHYIKTLLP